MMIDLFIFVSVLPIANRPIDSKTKYFDVNAIETLFFETRTSETNTLTFFRMFLYDSSGKASERLALPNVEY